MARAQPLSWYFASLDFLPNSFLTNAIVNATSPMQMVTFTSFCSLMWGFSFCHDLYPFCTHPHAIESPHDVIQYFAPKWRRSIPAQNGTCIFKAIKRHVFLIYGSLFDVLIKRFHILTGEQDLVLNYTYICSHIVSTRTWLWEVTYKVEREKIPLRIINLWHFFSKSSISTQSELNAKTVSIKPLVLFKHISN